MNLTVAEAADYCRCSQATLNRLRVHGGGPPYTKQTGRVLYKAADLDRWLEAGKRNSTSDEPPGARQARPARAAR